MTKVGWPICPLPRPRQRFRHGASGSRPPDPQRNMMLRGSQRLGNPGYAHARRRRLRRVSRTLWLFVLTGAAISGAGRAQAAGSLHFLANDPMQYDFADQRSFPPRFGPGAVTLELWIEAGNSYPSGRDTAD